MPRKILDVLAVAIFNCPAGAWPCAGARDASEISAAAATSSDTSETCLAFIIGISLSLGCGSPELRRDAEREADDLRVVFVVLVDRPGEVDGDRRVPKDRHHQSDARADAGTDCIDLELFFNRPGVGKDDAAQSIPSLGEGNLETPGEREVAADGVFLEPAAGADAAEAEAADAADAAPVEPFEERS